MAGGKLEVYRQSSVGDFQMITGMEGSAVIWSGLTWWNAGREIYVIVKTFGIAAARG